MAKPKKDEYKIIDEGQVVEELASEAIHKEWKHFIFLGSLVLLGTWFYSQYKETVMQKDGEASGQFSTASTELSTLIGETLKGTASKELLEKEDRVLKNLEHVSELKQATYSTFGSILKSAYLIYKDKTPSITDISALEDSVLKYQNVKEALVLRELVGLIKCRALIQSGDKEGAILSIKSFLNDSKVLFAEGASLLLVTSAEDQIADNLEFVKEKLGVKPELEDATNKALAELGFSL